MTPLAPNADLLPATLPWEVSSLHPTPRQGENPLLQGESSVEELAILLDKAQDAILVRDLDHRITYWNDSAERLFGWTAEEVIGRKAREFLYPNEIEFDQAMVKLLQQGDWVGELSEIDKSGRELIVETRWTLVRDEEGNPKSVFCIETDITERKRQHRQFLRAQRMESIGTLAGGIAHDLNNVLSPILMCIDLLRTNEADAERLAILSAIESSAQRGADMVKQLLSFVHGVEGRRLEVQISQLLCDIEKIANETFLKNIQVRTIIAADPWIVVGDSTQLHQVLLNLCVNARDAMPDGGTLTLSAKNVRLNERDLAIDPHAKPGCYVLIQVEDTGIGMRQEVIDRIFEPFFTTKELGKGTGLGLPTSMAIVRSHGGFIRVASEPSKGSIFSVFLPAEVRTSHPIETTTPSQPPRGRGETILIVDDEASVRQITAKTLENAGYHTLLAADGAEAIAIYSQHMARIDLVLTDVMMPLMDGTATIRALHRMNPDVRIVVASGLPPSARLNQAAHSVVKHFLPKPYTAQTILTVLRNVLTAPQ
jgi:PAS domain S-box-containing protein